MTVPSRWAGTNGSAICSHLHHVAVMHAVAKPFTRIFQKSMMKRSERENRIDSPYNWQAHYQLGKVDEEFTLSYTRCGLCELARTKHWQFPICLTFTLWTLMVSAPNLSAISSAIAWQLSYTTTIDSCFIIPQKFTCASRPYIESIRQVSEKGRSSDFPPLPEKDTCYKYNKNNWLSHITLFFIINTSPIPFFHIRY